MSTYETDRIIPLTEDDLNRVVRGHDENGYVILPSDCQSFFESDDGIKELWKIYSYLPIYGCYEEGQPIASMEKSFVVFPFILAEKKGIEFDIFIEDIFTMADKCNQSVILVKYPNKKPMYYNLRDKKFEEDYELSGTTLNDIIKEYYAKLKTQDLTIECYMNDFPNGIGEHRIRTMLGELVRFKNYPSRQ